VGRFLVWTVLGFGGKPNPLVFARAASFAGRTAQAMLRTSPTSAGCQRAAVTRIQVYVDDPIAATMGSEAERALAADLIIWWWLVLGVDLAWTKGLWSTGVHRWIGADFRWIRAPDDTTRDLPSPRSSGGCIVSAPPEFLADLASRLVPFASGRGHASTQEVDILLGRCGRLAVIVPAAKPYVTALWGALAGSRAAASSGRLEAPPGRHATRRFASAAKWLQLLIDPPAAQTLDGILPLEHAVVLQLPVITLEGPTIHVDASPWGAGAVLLQRGRPAEYAWCAWTASSAKRLEIDIGTPAGQTAWEYLALLLALILWASRFSAQGLAVLGDNLSSLNSIVSYRGRRHLAQITREVAWRKVRLGWHFAAGHLPSEMNVLADPLSRVAAPGAHAKKVPKALCDASLVAFPDQDSIWSFLP